LHSLQDFFLCNAAAEFYVRIVAVLLLLRFIVLVPQRLRKDTPFQPSPRSLHHYLSHSLSLDLFINIWGNCFYHKKYKVITAAHEKATLFATCSF